MNPAVTEICSQIKLSSLPGMMMTTTLPENKSTKKIEIKLNSNFAKEVKDNKIDIKAPSGFASSSSAAANPRQENLRFYSIYSRNFDVTKHKSRGQTTWSDLKQDEVKSAFQKSIRRGEYNGVSAVQLGLEMFLCGKAIRTNIITRTLVTSVEDIGPAQPEAFACAADFLVPFYKRNKSDIVCGNDIMAFVVICVYLARSAKSRINDWGVNLFPELKNAQNPLDAVYIHDVEEFEIPLLTNLIKKDTRVCLYIAKIICYHPRELKMMDPTYKATKAHIVLWRVFDRYLMTLPDKERRKGVEYLKRLKTVAFMPNWKWNSNYSCLLHAQFITIACCRKDGFNIDIPKLSLPIRSDNSEAKLQTSLPIRSDNSEAKLQTLYSLVEDILTRKMNNPIIPDYAKDMHTRDGSRMGRGIQHFLTEGSKLVNEDPEFAKLSEEFKREGFHQRA
jgi:hypothetical protein